jgi:uncharacterized membrane protein (DUF2068 family)
MSHPRGRLGDRAIVIFKYVKAAVEATATFALIIYDEQGAARLAHLVHRHATTAWAHLLSHGITAAGTRPSDIMVLALSVDAVCTFVEGWAIQRAYVWAPWLVLVATGAFLPLEAVSLAHHPSWVRLLLLLTNAGVVIYMARRLRRHRHAPATPAPRARRWWAVGPALVTTYLLTSYVILPRVVHHRALSTAVRTAPFRTTNARGTPSDPVNVVVVGTRDQLFASLRRAGWTEADPITDRSAMKIAESVLLKRSDPAAPVSSLFLNGRHQDVAFEQQVGGNPRHRHHVRFWLHTGNAVQGRPVWLGAATYDRRVGLDRETGQITHVIDANVDAERDKLVADLIRSGPAEDWSWTPGAGPIAPTANTHFFTDGRAAVVVLASTAPRPAR